MKTKFLAFALLLAASLTSWAGHPSTITQENLNRIQLRQTTEPDLLRLFGPPTTRFVDLTHHVQVDWFRSVPAPIPSYLPIIGPFVSPPDVEAQQLTVLLSPDGRVVRYEVHSSKNTLHVATSTATSTTIVERSGYAK
ncbi:MAG: hypothetical protein ACR2G0_00495 [Chthoniobacterales bacterium]